MDQILDIFRDLPGFLDGFIANHGAWVYALLFAIIFAETGLVVAPFLPGDSLLFTVGALAARGSMNVWAISSLLILAAVLGDAVNYHIGKWIGPRVFRKDLAAAAKPTLFERLLNRKHLDKAHAFFEKYGGKAVILARFVPIVRTFVPFVAGASKLPYSRFLTYNLTGVAAWVGICVFAGYFFGNIPVIQRNFELAVLGVIVVSLIPLAVEFIKSRRETAAEAAS